MRGGDEVSTIYGVMTPMARAALAAIRLSGPSSVDILHKLTRSDPPGPGMLRPRKLYDPETGELLDEAMAVYFAAPNTYTGEDVVELHLHGNPVLVQHVVACLPQLGARLAQPGEFTLRAFLNGKKDLAQAEAVHDLVEARTVSAVALAARGVSGQLSSRLQEIRLQLFDLLVQLEAEIDFPEDVAPTSAQQIRDSIDEALARCEDLSQGYRRARLLKEGFKVVLAGPPNVGKSSLFNALLGRERAIVTDEAGTTRDFLEEYLPETTLPILLVDTAGLRETQSAAESLGVQRSHKQISDANLVLCLWNPLAQPMPELDGVTRQRLVVTHADVPEVAPLLKSVSCCWAAVSGRTGQGVVDLRQLLLEEARREMLGDTETLALVANARQAESLQRAMAELEEARQQCGVLPVDILASLVRKAWDQLGHMTGENLSEQVLNTIFSKFCIGK